MTCITLTALFFSAALALSGLVASLVPGIPGPPLSALALLTLQVGLWLDGLEHPLGWVAAIVSLLTGAVATVIDLLAPMLADRIRKSSRMAIVGSWVGMLAAMIASTFISAVLGGVGVAGSLISAGLALIVSTVFTAIISIALFFLFPMLGATIGELLAGIPSLPRGSSVSDQLRAALTVGALQALGLLVTTVAKVIYGAIVILTLVILIIEAAV